MPSPIRENRRYHNHDPDLMGLDRVAISVKSHRLLHQLLSENPKLEKIMRYAKTEIEALIGIRSWVMEVLAGNHRANAFYRGELANENPYEKLSWKDFAAIRLLDYIDHAGMAYRDQNLRGVAAVNNPIKMIWLAVNHGTGGARPAFFEDMIHLFRQFEGVETRELPDRHQVEKWMDRFPSGLDPRIVKLREENRDRILNLIIDKMESGEIVDRKYCFGPDLSPEQKFLQALEWWDDYRFHLKFAVRSADLLNEMLGNSLDPDTMKVLYEPSRPPFRSLSIPTTFPCCMSGYPILPLELIWPSAITCSTAGSWLRNSAISWPGKRRTRSNRENPTPPAGCCRLSTIFTEGTRKSQFSSPIPRGGPAGGSVPPARECTRSRKGS